MKIGIRAKLAETVLAQGVADESKRKQNQAKPKMLNALAKFLATNTIKPTPILTKQLFPQYYRVFLSEQKRNKQTNPNP